MNKAVKNEQPGARTSKWIFYSLLIVHCSLLGVPGRAATITAASCSQSDVNAVINGPTHVAVDGDTVNIPRGTCTWTASLTISAGISLMGAGAGSTVILDYINQSNMFIVPLPSASSNFRLSAMSLQPSPNLGPAMAIGSGNGAIANISGSCNATTCSHVRLDNLSISGWLYGTGPTQNFGGFLLEINNAFGVMDHLNVLFTSGGEFVALGLSSYGGVGSYGDNSWAEPDSFGTDNAFYIESSTFVANSSMAVTDTDNPAGGGARFVVRFNNLTNAFIVDHGTESSGRVRGGRQKEVYGNTVLCTNTASGCPGLIGYRSGVGLNFNNTYSKGSGSWYNSFVNMGVYRANTSFAPWGACNGASPFDDNDGTVYAAGTVGAVSASGVSAIITDSSKSWSVNQWVNNPPGSPFSLVNRTGSNNGNGAIISANDAHTVTATGWNSPPPFNVGDSYQILRARVCLDQPGRGAGALLSGYSPSPAAWPHQSLDPVYEWNESGPRPVFASLTAMPHMIANRDFYSDNAMGTPQMQTSTTSPFDGTAGIGFGTLANRPTTCTPRVGYWATDQGSWNQSGSGGQGQLYVCTATNTWTLHYTPYTYPHPLTSGDTVPPAAPTNLRVN